jgi:hypothetical protein
LVQHIAHDRIDDSGGVVNELLLLAKAAKGTRSCCGQLVRRITHDRINDGGGVVNKSLLLAKAAKGTTQAQQSSETLNRVINGPSSKERERDVRNDKFARGETATITSSTMDWQAGRSGKRR